MVIHIPPQAIFLAHGPAFKRGLTVDGFDNIQLYSLMCGGCILLSTATVVKYKTVLTCT